MSARQTAKTARKKSGATGKMRPSASSKSYRAAWEAAGDAKRGTKERVAALEGLTRAVCDDNAMLQGVLHTLRDTATPIAVRLAALQTLQAASFSVIKFNACRADYLKALRSVASDADPELRQRVLGILSREQDAYAQKLLLEGLQDPKKSLVPPEKALQLLSYDVHAEAYPVARKIVRKPPNPAARREALRLLSADAASAPVFERILRDKTEPTDLRQLSAAVLRSLAPKKLQAYARAIVLDQSESNPLKATSLTALTQFGEEKAIAADSVLQEGVDRLTEKGTPAGLQRGARNFLSKYRR